MGSQCTESSGQVRSQRIVEIKPEMQNVKDGGPVATGWREMGTAWGSNGEREKSRCPQ